MWRGALFGSKCMEIKVSYVQARRFIDFHTLILNSYILFIIVLEMHLWYTEIMQIIVDFSHGKRRKTDEKNDTENACGRIVVCALYRVWCGAEN